MINLFAKKFIAILIVCFIKYCQAGDASLSSHYNPNNEVSLGSQNIQRLMADSTPYPAAGFRPHHQFNLPRAQQPLFPLATGQFSRNRYRNINNNNNNNNNNNFNVDNNNEDFLRNRPELLYGAPLNDIDRSASSFQRSFGNSQNSLNNRPNLKYGPPREKFDSLGDFQRLRSLQRASFSAQLPQSIENFESLQKSQYNSRSSAYKPERLTYNRKNGLENGLARAQPKRLKSERLIDNRENREDHEDPEDDDYDESVTPTDIEVVSTNSVGNKKSNQGDAATPLVTYYPASAIGFVQPLTSTSTYPLTATPINPTASFYQSQPIVYSASGRPLQAW